MLPDNHLSRLSILAVHSGAVGDVILFGRLLERLAAPRRVTLVTGGEKGRLLEGLGVVGRALDFDTLPMHELFTDSADAPSRLPGLLGKHDRLVSCFAAGDARAQMRLAAACGAQRAAFLPIRPEEGFDGHLLELWCDLLEMKAEGREQRVDGERQSADDSYCLPSALRLPPSLFTAWPVPKAWRTEARESLKGLGVKAPPVVLHVGAGSPKKCWPLENFITLGWRLSQGQPETPVVFALGPAEMERLEPPLLRELKRNFPVLECPPLSALAGVLAGCRAYVGNDSGVSHLAAVVGAPCLALFGPTNPTHFRPLGPRVRIIQARSMVDIAVGRVLDELAAACL